MSAFDNVAARLKEHLPFKKGTTTPITAWADQAKALNKIAADVNGLMDRVYKLEHPTTPEPTPEPEPEPVPPPQNKYAPRSYNTSAGGDARFCCTEQYGCVRQGGGWIDAMGVTYDIDGRDLGGRTKTIVAGIKPSNEMDGRAPCEPYEYQGKTVGGNAGYPAASFER